MTRQTIGTSERDPRRLASLVWPAVAVVALAAFAVACGSGSDEPDPDSSGDASSTPAATAPLTAEECIADHGYPCDRDQVDPAILELEDRYAAQLMGMLDSGTREDALDWIKAQDGVVETYIDETMLVFRLDGGMPFVVLEPIVSDGEAEGSTGAGLERPPPQPIRLDTGRAPEAGARPPEGVVGAGTNRDNPQNRKRALILTPYQFQGLSMFGTAEQNPVELLREIPDYNHDPSDVVHLKDDEVTPETFLGWRDYDAIFVETHGGQSTLFGTWIAIGTKVPWPFGTDNFNDLCKKIKSPYKSTGNYPGLDCNSLIEKKTNTKYVNLGFWSWFFKNTYGDSGGLDKAIIYMGGCVTLAPSNPDIAGYLAGSSSAYLGWTGTVFFHKEGSTAAGLLFLLAQQRNGRQMPLDAAHEFLCNARRPDGTLVHGCGGVGFTKSGKTSLDIYAIGDEPKKLRLYDLPTVRDPRSPTSVGPGLMDGAELRIEGVPGDGEPDKLDIAVDVTGVIHPEGTGAGDEGLPVGRTLPSSSGDLTIAYRAQEGDPVDRYNLAFLIDDQEVGKDNLGQALRRQEENPSVSTRITQLNDTTYHYVFTADLPFDVDPEGTEVTLKVVVSLPEGGVSDYEVKVRLVPFEAGAKVTVGGESWELELDTSFSASGCLLGPNGVLAAGFVDGDQLGVGFFADIRRDGGGELTVKSPDGSWEWVALADRANVTELHLVPEEHSKIKSVKFEGSTISGTAAFIDAVAVHEAFSTNSPLPGSQDGKFEIHCGEEVE